MRQLTNSSAAVTLARSYEPFGDTLASGGTGGTAFQFTGEARDATGLSYMRARYYASTFGGWTSRDPWQGEVKTPGTSLPELAPFDLQYAPVLLPLFAANTLTVSSR